MARADEWRERRDLRLEMLADTPIAFGDTLERARGYGDDEWRDRARSAVRPGSCSAVAVVGGRWVGTMGAFTAGAGRAVLVTVYVSPGWRGRDAAVADRLLDAVEGWVRDETPAVSLALDVHEDNARAIAFYRRRGFAPTGRSHPYPIDGTRRELELEHPVDRSRPGT